MLLLLYTLIETLWGMIQRLTAALIYTVAPDMSPAELGAQAAALPKLPQHLLIAVVRGQICPRIASVCLSCLHAPPPSFSSPAAGARAISLDTVRCCAHGTAY